MGTHAAMQQGIPPRNAYFPLMVALLAVLSPLHLRFQQRASDTAALRLACLLYICYCLAVTAPLQTPLYTPLYPIMGGLLGSGRDLPPMKNMSELVLPAPLRP